MQRFGADGRRAVWENRRTTDDDDGDTPMPQDALEG